MNRTGIEWVASIGRMGFTWNPIVGCSKGCAFCYARRLAKRFKHMCWRCGEFIPHMHRERFDQPLKRKKPANIVVCSMGELFDRAISVPVMDDIMDVIRRANWHTFYILTKEPEVMRNIVMPMIATYGAEAFKHVWFGVSVTNQADADERIPKLLEMAGVKKFVSYEPAHGPVDFTSSLCIRVNAQTWICIRERLDWLIIGAETGNRVDKVTPERQWVCDAVNQCREARVPVFVKDNLAAIYPAFDGVQEKVS